MYLTKKDLEQEKFKNFAIEEEELLLAQSQNDMLMVESKECRNEYRNAIMQVQRYNNLRQI